MNYGEFIEQPDGTAIQDRRLCDPPVNTICIVYPNGGYSFRQADLLGWVPFNFGKCSDKETAKMVADSTGWEP